MVEKKKIKKILFVCTENSGRSRIAEVAFNKLAKARGLEYRSESAGTFPKDKINPLIRDYLREKAMSRMHLYQGN